MLKIWNLREFKIKNQSQIHDGKIHALAISPNGDFIATGGDDLIVKICYSNNIEKTLTFYKTHSPIIDLAFNPK